MNAWERALEGAQQGPRQRIGQCGPVVANESPPGKNASPNSVVSATPFVGSP